MGYLMGCLLGYLLMHEEQLLLFLLLILNNLCCCEMYISNRFFGNERLLLFFLSGLFSISIWCLEFFRCRFVVSTFWTQFSGLVFRRPSRRRRDLLTILCGSRYNTGCSRSVFVGLVNNFSTSIDSYFLSFLRIGLYCVMQMDGMHDALPRPVRWEGCEVSFKQGALWPRLEMWFF